MSQGFRLLETRRGGWLAGFDPRLKLAWLAAVSVLSVLLDSGFALAVLFGMAALVTTGLRIRPRGWAALVGLLLAIAWGTLLSQALFYDRAPRTVLFTIVGPFDLLGWRFPGLRCYREGAWHGLAQSLRALAVMVTGLSVCLSTSPQRLLAALGRLGVPVPVGFTVTAALRFLPTVLEELMTVRRARRLRGYRPRIWDRRAAWETVRSEFSLLLPVLAASLRRASALAASVASRGFDPSRPRTYYPPLRFRPAERVALAGLFVTVTAAVTAKVLFWMYLGEVFYDPRLRAMYDFVRVWM